MKNSIDQPIQKANFRQAKVFIVEDNDDQWLLIQHAMKQTLAEVTLYRVATAGQALEQLHQWQYQEWDCPKLILLDLYLPQCLDGLQVLTAVKAMAAPMNHIPIVTLSSSAERADIINAYERGASAYMVKPVLAAEWLLFFQRLRAYWWETAMLPRSGFSF